MKESTTMSTILVTAPTGHVGAALVPLLEARDITVRPLTARGAEVPEISALADAMDGIEAVFLACGNLPGQVEYETAVIDAAARAGVRRLVKLSARGAAIGASVAFWDWHGVIEQHLTASDVPATVLRPSFFMTNLLEAADQVRLGSMLFAPAGSGRIAMIDPRDVAQAAAAALTSDGHEGRTYVLTGPQAVTYEQVARHLSTATGRQIGYADVPPEAALMGLTEAGVPPFAAQEIVNAYAALRRGDQERTTNAVRALTGREARTLRDFAADHATAFGAAELSR
jgi:uncharacterized protein YbjT (DUF2867 family)